MANIIKQQHTTLPQKLMAVILGMLLVMQTACMNHGQYLGAKEKSYAEELAELYGIELDKGLTTTARLALQEKGAKKRINNIILQDPINVLDVSEPKYQWTAIPDSGIGGLQQYTLSLKFEIHNKILETIDMEGIKATYSLPQKEFAQAMNLEGLLSSDQPRTCIMDLGTKTRYDWEDWLLSAKGYYHIRLLTRTGDKATEIAELIGGNNIKAVKNKINILIQEQRVSSGQMALIDIIEILKNLNPELLQRLTKEQLVDLNPIREDVSGLFKRGNRWKIGNFNIFGLLHPKKRQ